jgi:hypothetical protein
MVAVTLPAIPFNSLLHSLYPPSGVGEFLCQNGRTYTGEWAEGKRNGKVCRSSELQENNSR